MDHIKFQTVQELVHAVFLNCDSGQIVFFFFVAMWFVGS